MPIYKRCGRCGKRIPSGSVCECIKKAQKERYKLYDRQSRDAESKTFYLSREWQQVREKTLELDGGIDVYAYMVRGEILAADTVHHIVPLKDDWDKRCELLNLISLHHDTHSEIESKYKHNKNEMISELTRMIERYRAAM